MACMRFNIKPALHMIFPIVLKYSLCYVTVFLKIVCHYRPTYLSNLPEISLCFSCVFVSCCSGLFHRCKIVLYCIVSINLYSASCSAHQSEALPVRETQREESSL